ncbi:MAG: matrixin family metalloprotease [Acidobacteria bacterium]|nr:matrixin family metalloprotease [Acidobacteriota bacterium]MBI3279935.1 matrixin family metalloprotease [Acidobacteriota bacterium]
MRLLLALVLAAGPAAAEVFTYWIEPCTHREAECQPADEELAEWAMQAWENASGGLLDFERSPLSKARIRLYWAANGNAGLYGEARAIHVDGKSGAELYIRPDLQALGHKVAGAAGKDRLFRHVIVYLTCLHEAGHALGLEHTRSFSDIMYSFEYGGDILEYFGRYRRKLARREDIRSTPGYSAEDQKHLLALYKPREARANGSGVSSGDGETQQQRARQPQKR